MIFLETSPELIVFLPGALLGRVEGVQMEQQSSLLLHILICVQPSAALQSCLFEKADVF